MIDKLKSLSYDEIYDFYLDFYQNELGLLKFNKALNKIINSNKISGLIARSRYQGLPPGSKDFLYAINEIPYFIFARGQTQALGALFSLERWNREVNSQLNILDDYGLKLRALDIIEESKITFF